MVFGLSAKEKKSRRVSKFAEDIIIRKEVAKERAKQRILKFERRKAKAVARIKRPPLKVFGRKVRGIAVKSGRRAGKELGKSLKGFAQKIGKPSEAEKETVIIIGGKPKRVKGRVRVIRAQQEPFGGDLGLSVDLLGKQPRRKRPMRFF